MSEEGSQGGGSELPAATARRLGDRQDLHAKILRRMALVDSARLVEALSICAFGPLNDEWYPDIEYLITNALSIPPAVGRPAPSEKDLSALFRLASQLKFAEIWAAIGSKTDDLAASVALHEIGVRVKADAEQMLQESLDRLEAHDEWMRANLGFGGRAPALFASEVLAIIRRRAQATLPDAFFAEARFWEAHTYTRKVGGQSVYFPDLELKRKALSCLRLATGDLHTAAVRAGCDAELGALLCRLSQAVGSSAPKASFAGRSSLYDRPFVALPDGQFLLPLPTALAECVADTFVNDMLGDSAYHAAALDAKGSTAEKRCLTVLQRAAQKDFIFPNPGRSEGKELADALLWIGDTLAIVQVKSRRLPGANGRVDLDGLKVYVRKTVGGAVKQARGARRTLYEGAKVALYNSRRGSVSLDRSMVNRVFLLIILDERFPFYGLEELGVEVGAQSDDFPHVFYLNDLEVILAELDTPTDFFQYLEAREELQRRGKYQISDEMDILGYYLRYGGSFPPVEKEDEVSSVLLAGFWEGYTEPGGPRDQRRQADENSYYVDSVIDFAHTAGGQYIRAAELLAKLTRLERRMVAKHARDKAVAAVGSDRPRYDAVLLDRAGFGLLLMYWKEPRTQRRRTLEGLTTLAQHMFGVAIMLGIASEPADEPQASFDFLTINIPDFRPDPETQALARQFFAPLDMLSESEYPQESASNDNHHRGNAPT